MINRLAWRVQPIEQIRKRKQRKRDIWERHGKKNAPYGGEEQTKEQNDSQS